MIVAQVAMQTIALKRALDCPEHEWVKVADPGTPIVSQKALQEALGTKK